MIKNGLKILFVLFVSFVSHTGFLTAQIPAGYYYNAHNKKRDALKTALHQLASPERVLRYGSGRGNTWEGFFYTDQNFDDGSVIDMYSPIVRYFDGFRGVSGMHIEHAFPKSWWGGYEWTVYRDLFHLYPSDGPTNMSKSNNPLGVVTGTPTTDNGVSKVGPGNYPGYTGNVFEPADEFKGDFARSYLYVVTVYENLAPYWNSPMLDKNTYPVWKPWAIDLLMQWHQQDPVSIKEVLRQEEVFKIQGNRNPFIDYPDLVNYIWGSDSVHVYPFPVETDPFLVAPRQGASLSFDVILQGDSLAKDVFIQGVNLSSSLSLSLKNNNPNFFLQTLTLPHNNLQDGVVVEMVFCPSTSGSFIDTLVISGGGLSQPRMLRLTGRASKDFMALDAVDHTPVGATLNWITDPHASDYQLTVYQGAANAGNLLISSYVEGSGFNKGIELFNGTGKTLNLSDYSLAKQVNGEGPFRTQYALQGTLPNNQTYLVAINDSRNNLETISNAVIDSEFSFNGNDALALFHNGIMIDVVGYVDTGFDLFWGVDKTLKRKSGVTHPSTTYNEADWESYPMDYFDLLGQHQINFETPQIIFDAVSTQGNAHYIVTGLNPESTYNYFVDVIESGNSTRSVNSVQFKTTGLSAPEVNAAKDIQSSRFIANWEPDMYTNTFLLNVFQLVGSADTTIFEGFDNLGSNGKPLPDGWTGTASGYYNTEASSGVAPPSLQLRNTGEFVQTKVYPYPVTRFGFMYRFPSGAGASRIKVEALTGDNWVEIDNISYVNTSKYTLNYTFQLEDDMRAFRVTYANKATTANLALDDFSITYGNQLPVFLMQDEPVTGNEKAVDLLDPDTDYYYSVRAILGNSISPISETVKVTTTLETGLPTNVPEIKLMNTSDGILLSGLSTGTSVRVYSITGVLVSQQEVSRNSIYIRLKSPDVYILSVRHQDYSFHKKIIR